MVNIRSTGALWLDVLFLGTSFLALLVLFPLVQWTNPRQALDPNLQTLVLGFAAVGFGIAALGVLIGRRTHWKVPDPKVPKTR